MGLEEIAKTFEEAVVSTGLPRPPLLSQMLFAPSEEPSTIVPGPEPEQSMQGDIGGGHFIVTSETRPGWKRMADGTEIHVSHYDIPAHTSYGGTRRVDDKPKKRSSIYDNLLRRACYREE